MPGFENGSVAASQPPARLTSWQQWPRIRPRNEGDPAKKVVLKGKREVVHLGTRASARSLDEDEGKTQGRLDLSTRARENRLPQNEGERRRGRLDLRKRKKNAKSSRPQGEGKSEESSLDLEG